MAGRDIYGSSFDFGDFWNASTVCDASRAGNPSCRYPAQSLICTAEPSSLRAQFHAGLRLRAVHGCFTIKAVMELRSDVGADLIVVKKRVAVPLQPHHFADGVVRYRWQEAEVARD